MQPLASATKLDFLVQEKKEGWLDFILRAKKFDISWVFALVFLDSVWNCVDSNEAVAVTANYFVLLSFGHTCKRKAIWRWLKEFCLFLVFLLPTINLAKFYYLGNLADGFSVDFWELLTNLMSVHGLFRLDGYGSFGYSFVYYSCFINRLSFISTNVICSGNLTELLLIDLGNKMNIPIVHRWTSFFPTLRR